MIRGTGVDIIEIGRMQSFIRRGPRYLSRVFTADELIEASRRNMSLEFLAGRFAAKEAVAKCIGPPLGWQDVEVLPDNLGKPTVKLHGRAQAKAGDGWIHVSISHGKQYAIAFAVWECEP